MKANWYKTKIIKGNKIGEKIGFPTLNLKCTDILKEKKEGVYLVDIKIGPNYYSGLLFYGPRLVLKEKCSVVEIYVFGFSKNIYGKSVSFRLKNYIRETRFFPDLESLRKQIKKDYAKAQKILKNQQQ